MEQIIEGILKRLLAMESAIEHLDIRDKKKEEVINAVMMKASRQERKPGMVQSIFTTGQIARVCHVSNRTVAKWMEKKLLPGYKIPGGIDRRVRREDLIQFMKQHGIPCTDLEGEGKFQVICVEATTNWEISKISHHLRSQLSSTVYNIEIVNNSFDLGIQVGKRTPDFVVIDFNIGRSDAILMATKLNSDFPEVSKIAIKGEVESNPEYVKALGMLELFERTVDPTEIGSMIEQEVFRRSTELSSQKVRKRKMKTEVLI